MILITTKSLLRDVVQRWDRQYPPTSAAHHLEVGNRLRALKRPTKRAVERIIGNDTWTQAGRCNECDTPFSTLVQVGQEPDYDSSTAVLCRACVKQAARLMGIIK